MSSAVRPRGADTPKTPVLGSSQLAIVRCQYEMRAPLKENAASLLVITNSCALLHTMHVCHCPLAFRYLLDSTLFFLIPISEEESQHRASTTHWTPPASLNLLVAVGRNHHVEKNVCGVAQIRAKTYK